MKRFIEKQMDIASQIYDLINKKGFSQRELSEKSGVDEPSISEIIRGLANPTLKTIVKLENALNEDIIVTPKFFKKDLEKDGYTLIKSSFSEKLELSINKILESSFIPELDESKGSKEIDIPNSKEAKYKLDNEDINKVLEAA